MKMNGLVLEGGGMRGAFTAGALAWLNDNQVTFDYGVGISSGAVYLCNYWMGNKQIPYNMSVVYAANKDNVGLKAFQREGYYVAYKHIFEDDLIGREHMTVQEIRDQKAPIEIGAYDLKQGKTIFFDSQDLDDNLTLLRGCCALPVASAIVDYEDKRLLDGGITTMIPIERSVLHGCTRHLIITTKPADYVRKPTSRIVRCMIRHIYKQYPQVYQDYSIRQLNYYKQIGIIELLEKEKKAMTIRPSASIPISRFRGDKENCQKLYDLGYQDMETKRDDIMRFLAGEDLK
ncbi:MAG: patatin family protein [Erysipelotrichia bacterium]|nr:patatin family protein [Erysipelotrichia bacterium]